MRLAHEDGRKFLDMLPHLTVGHFYADATSHGAGIIPYCATFTIFTDYMRGAIRIAALSQAGTIFVTTHDSIAVPWAKFSTNFVCDFKVENKR